MCVQRRQEAGKLAWTMSAGIGFFLSCFCWAAPVLGVNGQPSWFVSTVESAEAGGYITSPGLAFDHYGMPAVSWSSYAPAMDSGTVKVSQLTGLGFWTHRQVATGTGVGYRTALAFDRAERPTTAWVNGNGTVFGQFDLNAPQQVGTGADVAHPALSLGYDLEGALRGMYGRATVGQFHGIAYSSGQFTSQSLVSISGAGTILDASLVTDHRGLRHIVAREELDGGQSGAVLLASETSPGGAWASSRIEAADTVVRGVDVAVDPVDGRLALAYTTLDNTSSESTLWYAKFNGFTLETTALQSSTQYGYEDVSLAFDFSDGRPAIAFEQSMPGPDALYFTYRDGASLWHAGLVDDSISLEPLVGGKPRRPSLAFDDYGTGWPAIAYIDSNGALNVAFDPPAPEPGSAILLMLGTAALGGRRARRVIRAA